MSVPPGLEPEPEYMDEKMVAAYAGITAKSLTQMLSRGDVPEPDLVWLGHKLWLVSTVEEWRTRTRKRTAPKRPKAPAEIRVRTPETKVLARPPKLYEPPKQKRTEPLEPKVGPETARRAALRLRAEGFWCTSEDVLELAGQPAVEGRERRVLQQRVDATLRMMRAEAREASSGEASAAAETPSVGASRG